MHLWGEAFLSTESTLHCYSWCIASSLIWCPAGIYQLHMNSLNYIGTCKTLACTYTQAIARLSKAAATLHDSAAVEAANKERAVIDKRLKDTDESKVAPLLAEVEKASARVAAQVRDVQAKLAGLRDKAVRLLADKAELVKKNTPPSVSA